MPSPAATPAAETTLTAPNAGEATGKGSEDSPSAVLLALVGALMACAAGAFGMRKLRRKV
jgi:hypothetical protein